MENNKLIAEFMDYPTSCDYWKDGRYEEGDDYYYVDGYYDPVWSSSNFHLDDMKFDMSWDWLMPVINKCYQEHMSQNIAEAVMTCDINKAYQAVVKFIKFIKEYNEQN